jgi:hypothetical protein
MRIERRRAFDDQPRRVDVRKRPASMRGRRKRRVNRARCTDRACGAGFRVQPQCSLTACRDGRTLHRRLSPPLRHDRPDAHAPRTAMTARQRLPRHAASCGAVHAGTGPALAPGRVLSCPYRGAPRSPTTFAGRRAARGGPASVPLAC